MSKGKPRKRPRGFGAVYLMGRVWWYRAPGDKRRSSGSTNKGDAEAKLQARLDELRIGSQMGVDPSQVTYEDMEAMLLSDLKANGRRSIADMEKSRLPHLRRFFTGRLARDIRYDTASAYIANRLETAKPATVLYEVKLLKRMFRLTYRAGKVTRLPDLPTVNVGDNSRKGFCSPEDIERVIGHLPEHAKAPVRCMYLTGWRCGEVLGLTWARVDFDAEELRLHGEDTKSGKPRAFPFRSFPALRELLHQQRERTRALEREEGRIISAVFHLDGEAVGSIRTAWRRAVKLAGLPGLIPHDLRRSAARNLIRAGVSEGVTMKLCGWSTRSMLARYDIAAAQDLDEGVARLGAFLDGKGAARQAVAR